MYKNILLVEDETMIAEMYADILRDEGFQVTVVEDGQKGLEEAQTGKYDLVLLDLMLPNVTGIEILAMLRDPSVSPLFTREDHHVIVLTNLNENDIITKEITSKAEGYYLKVNITPRKLAGIIKDMGGKGIPVTA